MPLPFSGQWVKLAITGGLLRYFEDLPFGYDVWCSVAAIGPVPVSLRVCFCLAASGSDYVCHHFSRVTTFLLFIDRFRISSNNGNKNCQTCHKNV